MTARRNNSRLIDRFETTAALVTLYPFQTLVCLADVSAEFEIVKKYFIIMMSQNHLYSMRRLLIDDYGTDSNGNKVQLQ